MMMLGDVSPELAEMRSAVRRFVDAELPAWAEEVDRTGRFPHGLLQALARQGYLGMRIAEQHGGPGMSLAQYCLVQEELSRCHPVFTVLVASTSGLAPMAIQRHGTPSQKRKYLPALARGELRTSFALTEPEAGSDASAIRTRATKADGGWQLQGRKHFISGADEAGVLLVLAVTDQQKRAKGGISAFLVDRGAPGFKITRVDTTMGSAAWTLAELEFDDCFVSSEALLGEPGGGFALAMESLNEGRLSVAATCLGAAGRLLEMSVDHARNRRTFGAPLADRQAIQWMLADSATEIAAARSLVSSTLHAFGAGQDIGPRASMCKLYCSEIAGRIADRAVQIHGGVGVVRGFPIERFFRDLRLFRVGEGSSEVQRMVIARHLLEDLQ
ncbi:MAG TPA: acyl-CoA dehydrogenase family protein [Burkholderiales bacterium]|jgi:acyl-CoA dehydrogenase|nr:acyl-CoA dehydrogenase family protein [Burkholderiales bacterium]